MPGSGRPAVPLPRSSGSASAHGPAGLGAAVGLEHGHPGQVEELHQVGVETGARRDHEPEPLAEHLLDCRLDPALRAPAQQPGAVLVLDALAHVGQERRRQTDHGRPDLGQRVEHAVGPALEGDRIATRELRGEEGATERVGERETEAEEVGLADDAERRHRGGLVGQRGVGEPHPAQYAVAEGS